MIDLSGKTAIVTGGSRGIGKATCLLMASAGANVVVGYHSNQAAAQSVLDEIQNTGGQALLHGADLTREDACAGLIETSVRHFSSADILVINAGIWQRAPIEDMSEGQWRTMLALNQDSVFFLCKHAAKHMKQVKRGKIVLIGSTAGVRGEAFHAHYAATKGAMIAFTKSLAAELGPYNINVNCLAPGWVLTDMTEEVFRDQGFRDRVEQQIPLGRIATPEDIAGGALFLASELARHVQGDTLNMNGGSVL